ncbi:hypothetical protein RJ640_025978 [Escallonia rubra]|uniref:Uncharacterized protein n=1 Tax=Escallonia rubra TaxID=112253 RepID=A0AA88QUR4_9ASTE|nr:hypothetical protein RJ640_025978 [Escallonia rubra]
MEIVENWKMALLHVLGNSDSQHAVLHGSLHLIHLRVIRQPEAAEEPAAAPLHAVPPVVLLFLLPVPLPADLEDPPFLHLHLHFLLLQPRQVRLEHVRLRCLLPVDPRVGHRRRVAGEFPARGREGAAGVREVLKGIPDIKRKGVEDVAWN